MWPMLRRFLGVVFLSAVAASAQVSVPVAASVQSKPLAFRDSRYGVQFTVPAGWELNKKDGQISTFRLDARTAKPGSKMRAVAIMDYNPFPHSTLSGVLFYYSVERHTNDRECEEQATGENTTALSRDRNSKYGVAAKRTENIGGMEFTHGYDQHGKICTEARDDVYTAFHKGSCYRFDLAINMFCSEVSGAEDLDLDQLNTLEAGMAGILSTVRFKWEKSGPRVVPPPSFVAAEPGKVKAKMGTAVGAS
jgi:hypothetical protein